MLMTAAEIVVRVTILLGAAAATTVLLRRSSAAARHLVWTLAIAGSLAVPAVSILAPRWEVPLLPGGALAPVVVGVGRTSAGDHADDVAVPPGAARRSVVSGVSRSAAPGSGVSGVSRTEAPGFSRSSARRIAGSWFAGWSSRSLLLALWLAGSVFVFLRLAVGTARMWWLAQRARPLADGRTLQLAARLARALGIRHDLVFLEGVVSAMPMTWGVRKPRILLPASATEWPAARLRVVLLHELAHVRRRDCLTQLLAQAACALYWFNPLVWLAARRLRAEREHACDDLVLAAGTRGSDYADHLLEIARSMRGTALPTWAAVAMAHRSQLEGRLMAILDPAVPRRVPTRRRTMVLVAATVAFAVPIALVTPVSNAAATVSAEDRDDARSLRMPIRPAEDAQAPARPVTLPSSVRRELPSILREAVNDAVPDAAADLAAEGWVPALFDGVLRSAGQAVGASAGQGQGQGQGVAGGVPGGVAGGVPGGVAGSEHEVEIEQEKPAGATGARRDPRVVAALAAALKDTDKEVRENAMHALANMRAPEALEAIRAALKDETPSIREQAAFALGQYRDKASIPSLAAALKDSSPSVREQAAFALGQIRDPQSADALAVALKDSSEKVREQAAFALGQLRRPESVDALAAALKDASAGVREQAAFALGQIRDRRAVDPLLGALTDANAAVREQVAFALGQLRDARAIEGLTAALKDASVEVRRQAAFALGQIAR
ncbi:MAG TPA: M56 family metallopeptidase [Vicinamibacterales bacterium]|nr:M56 family metallopeptidase [Vicinamibacterales bacterium]